MALIISASFLFSDKLMLIEANYIKIVLKFIMTIGKE